MCTNLSSFHSFGPPALLPLLPYSCTAVGQYTNPPPNHPFVCRTPYSIGNNNIVPLSDQFPVRVCSCPLCIMNRLWRPSIHTNSNPIFRFYLPCYLGFSSSHPYSHPYSGFTCRVILVFRPRFWPCPRTPRATSEIGGPLRPKLFWGIHTNSHTNAHPYSGSTCRAVLESRPRFWPCPLTPRATSEIGGPLRS